MKCPNCKQWLSYIHRFSPAERMQIVQPNEEGKYSFDHEKEKYINLGGRLQFTCPHCGDDITDSEEVAVDFIHRIYKDNKAIEEASKRR